MRNVVKCHSALFNVHWLENCRALTISYPPGIVAVCSHTKLELCLSWRLSWEHSLCLAWCIICHRFNQYQARLHVTTLVSTPQKCKRVNETLSRCVLFVEILLTDVISVN